MPALKIAPRLPGAVRAARPCTPVAPLTLQYADLTCNRVKPCAQRKRQSVRVLMQPPRAQSGSTPAFPNNSGPESSHTSISGASDGQDSAVNTNGGGGSPGGGGGGGGGDGSASPGPEGGDDQNGGKRGMFPVWVRVRMGAWAQCIDLELLSFIYQLSVPPLPRPCTSAALSDLCPDRICDLLTAQPPPPNSPFSVRAH